MSIWARIDTALLTDEKLLELEEDHALGSLIYVSAILYCRGRTTDGLFPEGAILSALPYAGASEVRRILGALVDVGLLDREGRGYVVNGYERWQQTADEVDELTEKRRAAGREGAKKRWKKREPVETEEDGKTDGCHNGKPDKYAGQIADDSKRIANAWHGDSKRMAEQEGEQEQEINPLSPDRPPQVEPAPPVDNSQGEREVRFTEVQVEALVAEFGAANAAQLPEIVALEERAKGKRFPDPFAQALIIGRWRLERGQWHTPRGRPRDTEPCTAAGCVGGIIEYDDGAAPCQECGGRGVVEKREVRA